MILGWRGYGYGQINIIYLKKEYLLNDTICLLIGVEYNMKKSRSSNVKCS
jgi:hypothetical protein